MSLSMLTVPPTEDVVVLDFDIGMNGLLLYTNRTNIFAKIGSVDFNVSVVQSKVVVDAGSIADFFNSIGSTAVPILNQFLEDGFRFPDILEVAIDYSPGYVSTSLFVNFPTGPEPHSLLVALVRTLIQVKLEIAAKQKELSDFLATLLNPSNWKPIPN